jgi:hypothetical protein
VDRLVFIHISDVRILPEQLRVHVATVDVVWVDLWEDVQHVSVHAGHLMAHVPLLLVHDCIVHRAARKLHGALLHVYRDRTPDRRLSSLLFDGFPPNFPWRSSP